MDDKVPFVLERPIGPMERFLHVISEARSYSNYIIAATYERGDGTVLSHVDVYRALRTVIQRHPRLSLILTSVSPAGGSGTLECWEARLREIDLTKVVIFKNQATPATRQDILHAIEEEHGVWFDTADRTQPLWRLVVLDGRHLLFVYHHCMADGLGGQLFHQDLLTALNEQDTSKPRDETPEAKANVCQSSAVAFPPELSESFAKKGYSAPNVANILNIIWLFILSKVLRNSSWIFSDAVTVKVPSLSGPIDKNNRCVTRLYNRTLSAEKLERCLELCRKNNATFTSLLATLVMMVTASDFYPTAKFGIVQTQVSLRRYLESSESHEMGNAVGSLSSNVWFHRYRTSTIDKHVDQEIWSRAREYGKELRAGLQVPKRGTPTPIGSLMSLTKLPKKNEEFASQIFPALNIGLRRAISISNLGSFDLPGPSTSAPQAWGVSQLINSGSAQNASIGFTLFIRSCSLKGGACSITANWQDGVLRAEVAEKLLDRVMDRLELLVNA